MWHDPARHAVAVPLSSPLFLMVTVFLGVPEGLPWPSTLYTTSMPSSTAQQQQLCLVAELAERHGVCSSHQPIRGCAVRMTKTRG